MITYVNTVLVGTGLGSIATSLENASKGQYVVVDNDGTVLSTGAEAAKAEAIKVGIVTGSTTYLDKSGASKTAPVIKWSNIIKKNDVKSFSFSEYEQDTEDTVVFDFAKAVAAAANGRIRIVVRLTFKDLPTRFRKWTESYEIVVAKGATAAEIVNAFVKSINLKNIKRARVIASNDSDKLKLVAMAYTDDESVESISPANKVRFNGNAWYTMPDAAGFASKNKYTAASIEKTPGTYYTASTKLVRDAEAQAMGYQGILNRGEGAWPIIKPAMATDMTKNYDTFTLEFENMYRTADDLQRKTKQTLQVFERTDASVRFVTGSGIMQGLPALIASFIGNESTSVNATAKGTSDTADKNTKYSAE